MGKEKQGVSKDRFMLIPRTLVFLTREDKVLLLKGAPTKRLWANCYNGVGGHVERGEDVLSAAFREVKEETGLAPDDLWLSGVIIINTGEDVGIEIFVFRGISEEGDPLPSSEGDLEWICVDEFDRIDLVEDLPILLEKVLSAERGSAPFYAYYSYDEENHLVIRFSPPTGFPSSRLGS